ncbi:MAG: hypothetical protein ACTSRZ_11100 [Promethearchaeota archaeon]
MSEANSDSNLIKKSYYCSICKKQHDVFLNKDLVKNRDKFPFSYVFLHGKVFDILTTLYLDANLNIRGAEMVKLENTENIFDKEQMMTIVQNLTNELTNLQNEYNELLKKYNELKQKCS